MKYFTFLLCLFLLFTACKKGELKAPVAPPCADTLRHDILSVNGPTNISINQEVAFNVTWKGFNNCDSFVSFEQDSAENTIDINALASHDSCSVCGLTAGSLKSSFYKFKAANAGVFYLKFFRSGASGPVAIVDTVTVK